MKCVHKHHILATSKRYQPFKGIWSKLWQEMVYDLDEVRPTASMKQEAEKVLILRRK